MEKLQTDPARHVEFLRKKRKHARVSVARRRKWLKANRPALWAARLKHKREHAKVQRRLDPRKNLWFGARKRARDCRVDFSITVEDIVVPTVCPALGIRLVMGDGKLSQSSPTIDRLSPARGYVRGNIAVISHLANSIKTNATAQQILAVGRWLHKLETPRT